MYTATKIKREWDRGVVSTFVSDDTKIEKHGRNRVCFFGDGSVLIENVYEPMPIGVHAFTPTEFKKCFSATPLEQW